jgi:hypothetical protein
MTFNSFCTFKSVRAHDCPLSPSPHANSFVIGTAVINTHTHTVVINTHTVVIQGLASPCSLIGSENASFPPPPKVPPIRYYHEVLVLQNK